MKQILLFIFLVLLLANCSQKTPEIKPEQADLKPVKEIQGIIPENIIQKAENKYGHFSRKRYEAYNKKLRTLQSASTQTKLKEINNFFNQVPYADDINTWKQKDYWTTPLEMLGKDKGDCEDYVIAKYFSLRDLGIGADKLYFSYVKSTNFTRTHMVLSYFLTPKSTPLILDSINLKIHPANKRKDLIPIYHFNGESIYRVRQKWQNGPKVLGDKRIHNRWDKLVYDVKNNKL